MWGGGGGGGGGAGGGVFLERGCNSFSFGGSQFIIY